MGRQGGGAGVPVCFCPEYFFPYLSHAFTPPKCQLMKRSRSFRRSSRRKSGKFSRRRGARNFRARVTRVLMKKAETKYLDIGFEDRQLYHNLGSEPNPPGVVIPVNVTSSSDWFDPWSKITQGTQRSQRIGDKITPRGISLKIYLACKQDRPNTMFRIIVASLPKQLNSVVTTNVFDPFQIPNIGTLGNNLEFPADHDDGVKFLYDRIHRVGQQFVTTGNKEMTKSVKLWIKSRRSREIVFHTFGTGIVNKPLAVYCIPYEQYSTLTTDRVGSWAGFMRLYYKDV